MAVNSQAEFVILSMKSKISRAIVALLQEVPGVQEVEFDRVRIVTHDFDDLSIPAIQLIDVGEFVEHENGRVKKTWSIALELVLKESEHGAVSQEDLWNFGYKVERALWKQPNLGIKGVIHLQYQGNTTDLHLLKPYYVLKLDFDVIYYDSLVNYC